MVDFDRDDFEALEELARESRVTVVTFIERAARTSVAVARAVRLMTRRGSARSL